MAQGRGILKVVSILFMVWGAIAIILSIIAIVGAAAVTVVTLGWAGFVLVAAVIVLIASVIQLVIGILGLKKSEDPSQANFFIVTGIVLCVLQFIGMIMHFTVTGLIGFVLPILFIVGGYMNRNSQTAQ